MHLSSPKSRFATPEDHDACRNAIKQGSRTFHAASLVLPPSVREPAYGLYAFCRLSDDAIDLDGGSIGALGRLLERLHCAYEGRPHAIATDRAMADLVRRFGIPRTLPEALLEGLAWDAEGRRYEDIGDLFDYAMRVAGTVGAMMTLMMGVRTPQALARACDLGVAMQLTNIARDVGEDARAGRLYLPLRWLREAGIDPDDFLAHPVADAPIKSVIARLLDEADRLYRRARDGVALLPFSCRPAILAAALLYAEIGRELERRSLDSIAHRARVPGARKAALVLRSLAMAPWISNDAFLPPLRAAEFLIEAVARSPAALRVRRSAIGDLGPQFLRVLDMFERLERAEKLGE